MRTIPPKIYFTGETAHNFPIHYRATVHEPFPSWRREIPEGAIIDVIQISKTGDDYPNDICTGVLIYLPERAIGFYSRGRDRLSEGDIVSCLKSKLGDFINAGDLLL